MGDNETEDGESDGNQGNYGEHNAKEFAAIEVGLSIGSPQSGYKKYQRHGGEQQAQPHNRALQGNMSKESGIATYGAERKQKSPPGRGVSAAYCRVGHATQFIRAAQS